MNESGTIYRDVAQGSDAWHALRMGKVTASRLADMLASTSKGWGAGRANYMAELVCERLTGRSPDRYKSTAMTFGSETEDAARQQYLFDMDALGETVAFVDHPTIAMSGCSPDLLIGKDGMAEIKCPNPATHIETLLGKSVPGHYLKQIYWQLECTGREYCDFVSYCPDLVPEMRVFKQRIMRNEGVQYAYRSEVAAFLTEVDAKIAALRAQYPERAA